MRAISLNMKALILCSVLISICYAQTPARPSIAETFDSQVKVIVRSSEVYEGSGIIAQDPEKGEAIQEYVYYRDGGNETSLYLLRADLDKEFRVTGNGSQLKCETHPVVNGTYVPQYWDWIRHAIYSGTVVIEGETLDRWLFSGAGLKIELMVDPKNVNVPRYINYLFNTRVTETKFVKFSAAVPDAKYFVIPDICQKQ